MEISLLEKLYSDLSYSRLFELEVNRLWERGLITGEMHSGTGEEAIISGVLAHVRDGDALALDHRGTSALLIRGVDPVLLLLEFMGHPQGLCAGQGGHMHLFSEPHLALSSGIVGASGPAAAGFALAARYKKTDNIAVAFFGEGAVNQGMLMESMNLASAWELPVLFVCKDNGMAITTESGSVTGGTLLDRAKGFGIPGMEIDGRDVRVVWQAAGEIITDIRETGRPFFLQTHCSHQDGHFLGDLLLKPIGPDLAIPLTRALFRRKGAARLTRLRSLIRILSVKGKASGQRRGAALTGFIELDKKRRRELDDLMRRRVHSALEKALTICRESAHPYRGAV